MKYEYAANDHGILTDAQALIVGKELMKLEKAKGCITPESIVEKARSQSSPMHQYFTWDDTKAAEKQRLHEARQVIRSVIILPVESKTENVKTVRAFVSVSSTENEARFKGRGYISMTRAMSDEEYKRQLLQDALNEANSWKTRFDTLKDFLSEVFAAIDRVEEGLEGGQLVTAK